MPGGGGDAAGKAVPVIMFRAVSDEDPAWALRAVRLLAAAALGAVLLGLIAFEWRQASVAAALETAVPRPGCPLKAAGTVLIPRRACSR